MPINPLEKANKPLMYSTIQRESNAVITLTSREDRVHIFGLTTPRFPLTFFRQSNDPLCTLPTRAHDYTGKYITKMIFLGHSPFHYTVSYRWDYVIERVNLISFQEYEGNEIFRLVKML